MGGISSHPCPYAECKTITRDPARSTQIRISSRVRNLVLNSSLALKVDRDSNQTLSHGIFDAPQSLLLFKFCVYLAKGALAAGGAPKPFVFSANEGFKFCRQILEAHFPYSPQIEGP